MHAPSSPIRESERERDIKRVERERNREKENLFLKGMMGALAPFSYLVLINNDNSLSVFRVVCPSDCQSVCPPVNLSVFPSVHQSVFPSLCVSFGYGDNLATYLPIIS